MRLKTLMLSTLMCLALAACKTPEEKAQEFYERGMALLAEEDYDRARVEFRNAVRESATMLPAHLELAQLHERAGNTRQAYRGFLRVAEQDPENVTALIALSEIAFLRQEWDVFERYSAPAIERAPGNIRVQALDLAGRYRTATLDEDTPAREAIMAEAQALEPEMPDSDVLRRVLIDGYITQQKYNDALIELDEAIAATPRNRRLYGTKMAILNQLQDSDGIEAQLRQMVTVFPNDESIQSNLLRFLVSRGKIDAAEDFMRARVAADEKNDAKKVDLIRFLVSARSSENAVKELDTIIAADPEAYTLRALRASLEYDAGDRDAAVTELETILAIEDSGIELSDKLNIKVTLANMLLRNGNEVGARRLVEEILTEDPNVVGALKMRARWMIAEDDTEGAINAMRTALSVAEQDSEAMTIMAEAYQRSGNQDLMLNTLSLAVEASNNAPAQSLRYAAALRSDDKALQAENILISALRLQPDNIELLSALGAVYFDLNDLARARQVADTLEQIGTPQSEALSSQIRLELLNREGNSDDVLRFLESLSAENSEDDRVKLALIQAKLQNGETDLALKMSADLLAENPNNPAYAYFNALTLASVGRYDAAIAELEALTEQVPTFETAWLQLARLKRAESSAQEVVAVIDTALQSNPRSGNLLWAKASFQQAAGDIDGAIEIYERLYAENSGSIVIANNLSSLLATFREDDASLERAQVIARRLRGTEVPAFQDTYGWILFRFGNVQEAVEYLEPAAAALTEDASVQYHLGMAYDALGRRDVALQQMQKALEKVGPLGSAALSDEIRSKIAELESASND